MTTDEIKVTAGILIDGMALLAMLSIPVLNWLESPKNKVKEPLFTDEELNEWYECEM